MEYREKLKFLSDNLNPFQIASDDEELKKILDELNLIKFENDPFLLTQEVLKLLEQFDFLN